MKSPIKSIIVAALAICSLLLAIPLPAQRVSSPQVLFSGTISNLTTTNINVGADVSGQQNMTISVTLQYNVTTASNRVYIPYHRRVDGSRKETIPFGFLTLTNNGTSAFTTVTNINIAGAEYVIFPYITNWSSDGDLTNFSLGYHLKTGSP